MNIILIGKQASGKGTQAELMAKEYGLFHFSTGDALRTEVAAGSKLGLHVKDIIEHGHLVGDDIMFDLVEKAVASHPEGIILDGFPRTMNQAQLIHNHIKIDAIVDINISDETALKRISHRFSCSKGHIYNFVTKKPRVKGVCDLDQLPLHQRDDDKPQAAKIRIENFHKRTIPVLNFFKEHKIPLLIINGEQDIEQVFADVKKALDAFRR